jgi:hypothetical protein
MVLRTARSALLAPLLLAACGWSSDEGGPLLTPPEQSQQAARGKCPREPELDLELPLWDLYLSSQAWEELHRDVTQTVQVDALLCVEGRAYPLELELQGASSRKHVKKSFDLKFAKAAPLDEATFGEREPLGRVLLKGMALDQTLVREALGFAAWRGLGHLAPRVGFTNLRINGKYWGLYNLVEPIDRAFLDRYAFAPGGHLYKAVRTKQGRADFKPGRNLHDGFEDKSDQASDAWPDLKNLAEKLQRTPQRYEAFKRDIDAIFPLAPYIDRMVWIAITQNSDAVAQNFYLYNVPVDGRDAWTLLPWDSNVAFGGHWSSPNEVVKTEDWPLVDSANYFSGRLLGVKELREQYIARFRALLDHGLSADDMLEHAAPLMERVRHDLAADQARWQRKAAPDDAFEVLESFVRDRPEVMLRELDALAQKHAPEAGVERDASAAQDAGEGDASDGGQR